MTKQELIQEIFDLLKTQEIKIQEIFDLLKAERRKEENMSYTENYIKLHLDKGIHLEIIKKQNYLSLQVHVETDSVDTTFERLSNIITLNSDLLNKELIANNSEYNNSKYKTKYAKVDAENTIMGLLKLYKEDKANWCGFELLNLEESEHNMHKIVDAALEYENNLKITKEEGN